MSRILYTLACCLFLLYSCEKASEYKKETLIGRWYLTEYSAPGQPPYTMIPNQDTTTSYIFNQDKTVVIKYDSSGIQKVEDGDWELRNDSLLTIKTLGYTSQLIINSLLLGTLKITDTNIPDSLPGRLRIYERK